VQAVHGPADLTWTEAAAALSTATGVSIKAQRITDDEQRAALRDAGLGEVAAAKVLRRRRTIRGRSIKWRRTPAANTP
jgi:NAD(P)H dehydrogenase (quinone)